MEQWYLYKKKANFNQIGEKFNIDPVIARLIRNRDVVGDEQIQQYLYGELSDISDPFLMKGVKEGVEILKQKVQEGKRSVLFQIMMWMELSQITFCGKRFMILVERLIFRFQTA